MFIFRTLSACDVTERQKTDFMTKTRLPSILCKYYRNNAFLKNALTNNEIYFASLTDLNDPFESLFAYDQDQKIIDFVSKNANDETRIKFTSEAEIKFVRTLLLSDAKARLSQFGIACFTIDPTHQLMWSHYAQNYQGVCLMFSLYHDVKYFEPIDRISYQETLPKIKNPGDEKLFFEELIDILFTKSSEWKYEREYRLMKRIGVHKYNPISLNGIIFGYKMAKKEVDEIVGITRHKYPHLDYLLAVPNPSEYKIDIYDYFDREKLEVIMDIDFDTQTNKSKNAYNFCVVEYGLDCICLECKPSGAD